jgi:uncharacterized phage protein gp47/JayE
MDPGVVALVTRLYQKIVDDLLTAVAGGVTNEPILYDTGSDRYPLARPASSLRSVTGTAGRRPGVTFTQEVDYTFDAGRNAVAWLPGGTAPDDGTTFYVDYFPANGLSPLTDLNVGSVTRTLTEAFARETALVYAEVNEAYRAGLVNTAAGASLDNVVAILGITRKTGGFAQGTVAFFRDPAVDGNVVIPQGTVLRTAKGTVEFVTTEPQTLQRGQARTDVPVRADDAFPGPAGQVGAGEISVLAQSLAGVEKVTNLDPTVLGGADETDDELRLRATTELQAAGKATLAALEHAIRDQGGSPVGARDPDGVPGRLALLVDAEPARLPDVIGAVHDTRAAGVLTSVQGHYVYVTPRIVGAVDPGLTAQGKQRAASEVVDAVQASVDALKAGQPLAGSSLLAAVSGVRGVTQPRVVEVLAATADLTGGSGPDTLLDDLVAAVAAAGPDPAALRATLSLVLADAATPAAEQRPAPELVVGLSGARATDAEIEAGTFSVLATVGGQSWWITLQMTTDDVHLIPGTGA